MSIGARPALRRAVLAYVPWFLFGGAARSQLVPDRPIPTVGDLAVPADERAEIEWSDDPEYATADTVARSGTPVVRIDGAVRRIADGPAPRARLMVRAGREIAVGSIIEFTKDNQQRLCGSFASFVPERGARYVVVANVDAKASFRIPAFSSSSTTCDLTMQRETPSGLVRVATRALGASACHVPES